MNKKIILGCGIAAVFAVLGTSCADGSTPAGSIIGLGEVNKGLSFSLFEEGVQSEQTYGELIDEALQNMSATSFELRLSCNVYAKPSGSASLLGSLGKGVTVSVYGKTEGEQWAVINYNGRIAYILTEYLKQDEPLPPSITSSEAQSSRPNENMSSEDTSSELTSSESTSSEEVSSEPTSSEETSSEDVSSELTPSEPTSSEETSSEDVSSELTSSEETSSEDISSEDTSSEETSSEDASGAYTSSEGASSEDIPGEDTSGENISSAEDETSAESELFADDDLTDNIEQ